ncbi:MAG: folB [Mucilaginibacter sp.]|jgi:dihydroneopterin aldolase|nr:folB [Mucilaginibacter sp.]
MISISIRGAEFFAYHGFYPEEQKLGNKFLVDVEVSFLPLTNLKDDKISNTIDYEQLYDVIDEQMKHTRKLIETVAQAIVDQIKDNYPVVEKIQISIKKLNPPLKGKVDYSCIVISA